MSDSCASTSKEKSKKSEPTSKGNSPSLDHQGSPTKSLSKSPSIKSPLDSGKKSPQIRRYSGRESISPDTEFRLTQLRQQAYHKRQEGLAEKSRRRVSDAIAVATKYLQKPFNLPELSVNEFLKACELEARARRLKTCQRASYFIKSPELCEDDIECVQCQVNRLREGLIRVYPSKRYRCELHCCSPTMDGGGERRSPSTTPVNICRRVELQSRCWSAKTPPPAPASSPFVGTLTQIQLTPETRIPTGITSISGVGFTPDSEYDNSKINNLIEKYIPKPKMVHYQCKPRTKMFLYTDKAKESNIVHHPYAVYKGNKILTANGKTKKNIIPEQAVFRVPKLGVAYTLPDINSNLGPRHNPPPAAPPKPWKRSQPLPPIKGQRLEEELNSMEIENYKLS